VIIQNLILVLGFIGIGSLIKRTAIFPDNTAEVLNKFILNISLPAIILVSIPKLQINMEMLVPVSIHWISFISNIIFILIAAKWLKFKRETLGVLIVVSTLGNTAFLGIPMIKTFLGAEALPYAVLYDQLGSGLGFIIMGAFILPLFTNKESKSIKDVLLGLIQFPPFVALIIGFLFKLVPLSSSLNFFFSSLAATLIPCAMISVGFQMKYRLPKTTLFPMGVALWIKLFIIPAIVLISTKLLGMHSLAAKTSVLQSGMPPMITAGAIAMEAKLNNELAASLVGYGLIISFITLSLFNYFL